jgi:peroxiredoxin Q/BCP
MNRVLQETAAKLSVPVAGKIAKEFELPDSTGAPRRLSELIAHGPLVLLFYRGNW